MKITELLVLEKRSNTDHPAQKKRAGIEHLLKYEGRDDIFISYTDVDKIGINPQSSYDTPIGIYAYPLADVLPRMKERMHSGSVPFAGRRPFIWVLQANPMSLQDYDSGDFDRDTNKLIDYMKKLNFAPGYISDLYTDAIRHARNSKFAGKMWNVTRTMAGAIANQTKTRTPVRWNKILSDVLGYQGIADHGEGIIHPNEKKQAVFFNKQSFQVIEKIHNIAPRISNKSSDEYIKGLLRSNPSHIRHLKDPSEELQLIAVTLDGYAVRLIDKPTEKVLLAAVKQAGPTIKFIKNPSEELQLIAVASKARIIRLIKNPTEKVQLAAVRDNQHSIMFIKNPSEEAQLAAVEIDGYTMQHIENPTEKVQLAAVVQFPSIISYIKNPSEEVQLAAVRSHGNALEYIKNPSEEVQLFAVNKDPKNIEYIRNPSERVKKAAGIA